MSDFTVFDIETTGKQPWNAKLLCAGIDGRAYRGAAAEKRMRALVASDALIVEHSYFDARWCLLAGMPLGDDVEVHDTMTMAWLLDEEQPLDLESLMRRYLGEEIVKPLRRLKGVVMWDTEKAPLAGETRKLVPIEDVPWSELERYNLNDLEEEARLYVELRDELVRENLWDLFLDEEVPLGRLIVEMEATGLPFNEHGNAKLRERVLLEHDELGIELIEKVGAPLNLRSPLQVGTYLFTKGTARIKGRVPVDEVPHNFVVEKTGRVWAHGHYAVKGRALNAPVPKRRSGRDAVNRIEAGKSIEALREWSTSSTDLVMENAEDEFVQDFVLWRELDKLDGFLERFPTFLRAGRMYGHINRTGTATGRFSSSEPNLQQIPAHGRFGPDVRALFRGKLVVADYSQLENRITAHFSEDPHLLRAYEEDIDLYGLAASLLFGGEPTKDHPQRGLLKTTILSLQYGAGFAKLAMLMTRGGHPTDTEGAKELVGRLREEFSAMFAWRDDIAEQAIREGYVETISGRRRRLDFDSDWMVRRDDLRWWVVSKEEGDRQKRRKRWHKKTDEERAYEIRNLTMERQAINAVVSGSAADIIDRAMLAAKNAAAPDEYRTLLQVHDEVLWERGRRWRGDASLAKIRAAGETGHGFTLKVPLKFEPMVVDDWSQKGVSQTGEGHVVKDRLAKARSEGMQARKASDFAADRRAMREIENAAKAGSGDEKGAAKARLAKLRAARNQR